MTAGRGRPARRWIPRSSSPRRASAARASTTRSATKTARHIRLASLVEQPPDPDNRVTLSAGLDPAIHAMAVPLTLRGDFTRRPLQLHQGF
jgi:hypothetical protein